jgi:CheY-like chemotaxis protein/anti-sigma regulatory factor (Ser/Thr protein kinase)
LLSSGNTTLDLLLGGGLEPGTACLMYGTTGAGKSTLASLYLQAAAERGEHGLLLCFDERRDTFIRRCRLLDLKVPDLMEAGRIELRHFESGGRIRRCFAVVKKRHGPHEHTIREFRISRGGCEVGPPLTDFHGVLSGTPVYHGDPDKLLPYGNDDLQQMLVSARLHTELLSDDLPSGSKSKTRQVYEILSTAIQTTRRLSHELNPVSVTDGSFHQGLKQLTTCATDDYGFDVRLTCSELNEQLSEELKLFIYRSLQELLLNCAKYAKAKQVTLDVVHDDAFVSVSLTDDGVGFDPERLTITGGDIGGFGLFSIQERTNALEGSLTIGSKPGEGSRFLLKLPVEQPPVDGKVTAIQAGSDDEKPTDVIAVMIAEDHAVMRQSLADLLGRHTGIKVVAQAADGELAVALAQQFQPRVVLMDVSMPLVDGIAATRKIVTGASEVAVIALSAAYDPDTRERMLAAGAHEILSKNVKADELIAAIRRHGHLVADAC